MEASPSHILKELRPRFELPYPKIKKCFCQFKTHPEAENAIIFTVIMLETKMPSQFCPPCQSLIAEEQDKKENWRKQESHKREKKNQGSVCHETKKYHWSQTQQAEYLSFLHRHKEIFELPWQQKRVLKIHVLMSKEISKRNPSQCRSHHQKMLTKYGSVDHILRKHWHLLGLGEFKESDSTQSSEFSKEQLPQISVQPVQRSCSWAFQRQEDADQFDYHRFLQLSFQVDLPVISLSDEQF